MMDFSIQSALLSHFIPIEPWFSGRAHWTMSGNKIASHYLGRVRRY